MDACSNACTGPRAAHRPDELPPGLLSLNDHIPVRDHHEHQSAPNPDTSGDRNAEPGAERCEHNTQQRRQYQPDQS
jgi:hypothetical protein